MILVSCSSPGFRNVHVRDAILFDLDGTLIDSLADLTGSLNQALLKNGYSSRTPEEVQRFIGDGMQKLVERATGERCAESAQVFTDFLTHYRLHCLDSTRLYPGVNRLLPLLARRYVCAVLSNKKAEFARRIVEGLGVAHHFRLIVGGDTFAIRKPHGLVVQATMQRLGSDVSRAIIVGDHVADLEAARNARAQAIYCCFGTGRSGASRVQRRVRSFLELGSILGIRY